LTVPGSVNTTSFSNAWAMNMTPRLRRNNNAA
jgi:hypothetical protein